MVRNTVSNARSGIAIQGGAVFTVKVHGRLVLVQVVEDRSQAIPAFDDLRRHAGFLIVVQFPQIWYWKK